MNALFQAGGAVRQGLLYIERPADQELPEALLKGEFCYVLAPRQIGKTSLALRTREKLSEAGAAASPWTSTKSAAMSRPSSGSTAC